MAAAISMGTPRAPTLSNTGPTTPPIPPNWWHLMQLSLREEAFASLRVACSVEVAQRVNVCEKIARFALTQVGSLDSQAGHAATHVREVIPQGCGEILKGAGGAGRPKVGSEGFVATVDRVTTHAALFPEHLGASHGVLGGGRHRHVLGDRGARTHPRARREGENNLERSPSGSPGAQQCRMPIRSGECAGCGPRPARILTATLHGWTGAPRTTLRTFPASMVEGWISTRCDRWRTTGCCGRPPAPDRSPARADSHAIPALAE